MGQKDKIYFHIFIAIAVFPLYSILGEYFKYLIAPYIFYLVWSKNPVFLPALFIHFSPGSTISFVILLTTFILTLSNINKFNKMNLKWVLLLVLLPAPIFLYQSIYRMLGMGLGLIDILKPLAFYLGVFPFFYGILIVKRINMNIIHSLIFVLFILPFLTFLPGVSIPVIRAYWLSFPLFFGIIGAKILLRDKFKIPIKWKMLSVVFIVIGGLIYGLKFTLIFTGLITIVTVIAIKHNYKSILNFIAKPKAIVISVLLVIGMIVGSEKYGNVQTEPGFNKENMSYFDWDEFWLLLRYKAFDDRSVLWAGGWDFIKENDLLWPPYSPPSYSFKSASGVSMENIEYGIHNIGLELMRNYGIIIGCMLTLAYLLILIKAPGRFLRADILNNDYLIILAAACLGTGLVGGIVGQFVLMNTFSFLLMSMSGIFFGLSLNIDLTSKQ